MLAAGINDYGPKQQRLITEGRVRVNGRIVTELGTKADPHKDKVEVNGVRVDPHGILIVRSAPAKAEGVR